MPEAEANDGRHQMEPSVVWYIGGEDVRYRLPLAKEVRGYGFTVALVGSWDPEESPTDKDVARYYYPLSRRFSPLADVTSAVHLYHLFRAHQPTIIHAFDTKPGFLAPLIGKVAGVPIRIRTITGLGYLFSSESLSSRLLRPIYRYLHGWAAKHASMTVFQNSEDRKDFRTWGLVSADDSILVRSSGLPWQEFQEELKDSISREALRDELELNGAKVVTMVSRLVRHKGVEEFLEAARGVKERRPEVRFLLVGPVDSEAREPIPLRVIDSYADSVDYLGWRDDIPLLLSLSDLFVLPTYYREGIPRVLLEACAAGLPVVCTEVPGCREVVTHDWNGKLVLPRDSDAVRAAIMEIVSLPGEDRAEMGRRSRRFVRNNFRLKDVTEAYVDLYRRLLSRTGR